MSVPLDRLYNFLHDLCNHDDILIYRFLPHGSKKIRDCSAIRLPNDNKVKEFCFKRIVCHDQEPLSRDYYNVVPQKIMHRLVEKKVLLYDKILLLHSEKNSIELQRFEQEDAIGVYWWSHAVIARDWFRYASLDPALKTRNHRYDFLIYNRAWTGSREYRLKVAELIINSGLHSNSIMNFSELDNQQDYRDHQFVNSDLQITRFDLEKYLQPNTAASCFSADYDAIDYQQCRIEVVLETLFDDQRLHLTEKTLRPIACGKPFILCATAGSLEYLRSYGFKTFSPWIDESYDTINNPLDRLQAVIKSMQQFSSLSIDQKNQALANMQSVCSYNQQRFFSKEFSEEIFKEYADNLNKGLEKLEQYKGKNFKNLMRAIGTTVGATKQVGAMFSRQELVQIWKQLR